MTRTKIDDLEEAPVTELSDEQLAQVRGGSDAGTQASNLVTGGEDTDAPVGHGHNII